MIQPLLKNTKKDHSAFLLIVFDRIELTSLKISKKIFTALLHFYAFKDGSFLNF